MKNTENSLLSGRPTSVGAGSARGQMRRGRLFLQLQSFCLFKFLSRKKKTLNPNKMETHFAFSEPHPTDTQIRRMGME